LSTSEYRHNLKKRILAGEANHMEILAHHYAFGSPRKKTVVDPPQPRRSSADLLKVLTKEELRKLAELLTNRDSSSGNGGSAPFAIRSIRIAER
jgi:hypothetical protein